MIGIDIVEIIRIQNGYERFGISFLKKFLNHKELDSIMSRKNFIQSAAARFAAKEAYVKASGNKSVQFNSLCILNDKNGKPFFENLSGYELSISHEKQYAVAVVMKNDK